MNRMSIRILPLLLALIAVNPAPALAWGEYGHETIADIASINASPKARTEMQRLFRAQRLLGTPACALGNIRDASVWPDCVRRDRVRWGYTAPWHYQNVNICKAFDLSPCRDGNCVSAQIDRNFALLKDRSLPDHVRLEALAFLVHFTGDLHQPLHAGDRADRGGNDVKANYGIIPGANLHWIWDSHLAERPISAAPAIIRRYNADERAAMAGGTAEDWSREAWAISRDDAYARALDRDPCEGDQSPPAAPVTIDEADMESSRDALRLQIQRAGLRLARLLDEALG
ncbi:S1/P1 nuclease [Sphingorhabdus arenilitoris]|uniref:S1/P1 nuclease n=1 Tax=Sphingorhabdus arenilitoris TaxID=1490041 RepID=A0ABV8RCT9_9SPHN